MNQLWFSIIGVFCFSIVFGIFIFAPTKGQTKIFLWAALKLLFFSALFTSWQTDNIVLKWILIEASTLFGSLLISSSGTEKSFQVGWKFLLINSYGLGIAFLGIIILLFASDPLTNLDFASLQVGLRGKESLLIETGILLVIYGYSAKLGLVPNHYWVGDTYAESPSQTSSLIAAFVPVSVALALRPMVELERERNPQFINSANGLLVLGILTMVYSVWVLHRREDIRRIAAKVALFHTGAFAVFIWLDVILPVFYYLLATTMLIKVIVFVSMGILRMDSGERTISKILEKGNLSKSSFYAYLLSLLFAFIFPLSPVFLLDLELIRTGLERNLIWLFAFPIFGALFFFIAVRKVFPLIGLQNRDFLPQMKKILSLRLVLFYFSLLVCLGLGVYGFSSLLHGGLGVY